MDVKEEITKFVRDALESRGTSQEIRTVEIGIDEFTEYLENADLKVGLATSGIFYRI
jgi:hypothetical protein